MNAQNLTDTDPWSVLLQKGTILWRNCGFSLTQDGYEVIPHDVIFDPTEQNSFLGRISMVGTTGLWEPEVLSNRVDDKHYTRGIAVFTSEIPPKHWTHLIISGTSRIFNDPGRPEKGGCVFARVGMPYDMEDYKKFRLRMFEAQRLELNATIERAAEISSSIWAGASKQGDSRLIVQPGWADGVHFRYVRIDK